MSVPDTNRDRIDADDALGYAFSSEYLVLFGLIVVGWLAAQGGTALLALQFGSPSSEGVFVVSGLAFAIGGAGAVFLGVVATAYKVLVETRGPTADRD
ncbi:hypothetical protein CV102_16170 [Natronococcus pandeyae]|uniref:Uncharacterized protein n=1 Tax=Natronococcus pandeyae TaxID=2055836 RepID=A0A8J8TP85_9EURY|nr:hypothetical protein [Natronococcus pandeyae]TYL37506.1 hypothetical protein CV102_16170 [Natronococcus pandeyae]